MKEYIKQIKKALDTKAKIRLRLSDNSDYDAMARLYEITIGRPGTKTFNTIAKFNIMPMRGCLGVAVSTGSIVYSDYRGFGIGTILSNLRVALAKELGYGSMICTFDDNNIPQKKILLKNKWDISNSFINPYTKHKLSYGIINLNNK
jgi:hypothetical protein